MNPWTENEKQFLLDNYKRYDNEELAGYLNKNEGAIRSMKMELKIRGGKRKLSDYAVYSGDTFLCLGTAEHCAEVLDVEAGTIRFWASKSYYKRVEKLNAFDTRMIAIKLEKESNAQE